ncbi:MAG: hypothetical protein ACO1PI_02580 [Bacteroidota bacterium]
MPFAFDQIKVTALSTDYKVFNVEAITNLGGAIIHTIKGIPSIDTYNKVSAINFNTSVASGDDRVEYKYDNLILSGVGANEYVTLKILGYDRARISINDTTFPPPPSEAISNDLPPNVLDMSNEFLFKKIEVVKTTSGFNFIIELVSNDTDKFIVKNPKCVLRNINVEIDGELKLITTLFLYPQKNNQLGVQEISFDAINLNLATINLGGLPILVVDGDPSKSDAEIVLPPPINGVPQMNKKGIIWIS